MNRPASVPEPGVLQAEELLTGVCMLVEIDEVLQAAALVSPRDFYGNCDEIFAAIVDLARAGTVPMVPYAAKELHRRGLLDEIGAESRLAELVSQELAFIYAGGTPRDGGGNYFIAPLANCIRQDAERRRALTDLEAQAQHIMRGQIDSRIPLYMRPEYQGEAGPLR